MKLTVGADPEVSAVVIIDGKEFVVSPALLKHFAGAKVLFGDAKHPFFINTKDFGWQMDGVAFEVTYYKLFKTYRDMAITSRNAIDALKEYLSTLKYNGMELQVHTKPVVNINNEWYEPYLDNEDIYQGFIFGCDKDYDAIDTNYESVTTDAKKDRFRYNGGHIHISGLGLYEFFPRPAIVASAMTIGNYCILNSQYPELELQRGMTYGRPFRYRQQHYKNGSYGIEYRTPSNSWLNYTDEQFDALFFWIYKGQEIFSNENKYMECATKYQDVTAEAIRTANKDLAKRILDNILQEF